MAFRQEPGSGLRSLLSRELNLSATSQDLP